MGIEKLLPLDRAVEAVAELKLQGKRVVFTNGCFDLLHP
ncbi:MAG: D-glycero-beta-D-manno-heptose 1-phosphate adenylyltransferase, partial [Acidobacteria bacterium]